MRALTAADILQVWETAYHCHPVDQAMAMLMLAEPGYSHDDLAALPLGDRDCRLLALRQLSFGDRLSGRTECPHCGEAVAFDLACGTLYAEAGGSGERQLRLGEYSLHVRPLNSFDVAAAARAADVVAARRILLGRCLIDAQCHGAPVDTEALPAAVSIAVAEAALVADPMAELLIDLACPGCGHNWEAPLDIGAMLWEELAVQAQRLLTEVHLLARAHGWREADILAMSPARRAAYLQRVTA